MSDPLTELDRAARLWAEQSREFGKHLRSDDETFGQVTVADSTARRRYEEALEAVRAENAELRTALRAVEWGPLPISAASECPFCLREHVHGHQADCLVGRALGPVRAMQQEARP